MTESALRQNARCAQASFEHELIRFESEMQFAETLCDLLPARGKEWRGLLGKAAQAVAKAAAAGDLSRLRQAVREAEAGLAPIAGAGKAYTVHFAGHAHIDMNWMWSWPETVSVTVDTAITMLKLMGEFPEFRFSQSQASIYAIIEKHRPDLMEKIAARVREGRWEVTASHWVEGDKNLAGAEALCRHLLLTRRYMKKLFGLEPEQVPVDWSPDTFGHAATVPTYLAQGGVKYLYMHRPGDAAAAKLWMFWWEGPDGARILVRNDTPSSHCYNGEVKGPVTVKDCSDFFKQTGLKDHLLIYGVGDHGGGPTRRDILQILEMREWPVFPRLEFGTVSGYMAKVEADAGALPVIGRELNFEFGGCYTSQTLIKKANRFAENRLADAETAAALEWAMLGSEYPAGLLDEGWRDTLFSQFHDILPGSGVHDTRTYTHGLFQKTMAATAQIETRALRELAARVNTARPPFPGRVPVPSSALGDGFGGGVGFLSAHGGVAASEQSGGHGPRPFVVFNPLLEDREEVAEATIWDNVPVTPSPIRKRQFVVMGPDGRVSPAQVVNNGNYWRHDYVTVAFRARVSAGGYALYTILEETPELKPEAIPESQQAFLTEPRHHCGYVYRERAPVGLENEFLRVDLNPVTGGILRLTDKRNGADLVTPAQNAPALEYRVERPHGMSSWLVQHSAVGPAPLLKDLRRKGAGPIKASVEAELRVEQSDFTLTYELRANDPALYLKIAGAWFQRGTRETGVPVLNFTLPLALDSTRARYEIAFGAVDRPLNRGEEVPALQWAQVQGVPAGREGATAGVLLLNDSKHGHSLSDSTLRLTLIRSSYEPDLFPEIGQHEINLALRPFGGELPVNAAIFAGCRFNRPVKVVGTDIHTGTWPAEGVLLRQTAPEVQVTGIKRAEDGDGLIVRMFNPTAGKAVARLLLHPDLAARVTGVALVDLLEREMKGSIKRSGRTVSAPIPPFGIATARIRLRPAGQS